MLTENEIIETNIVKGDSIMNYCYECEHNLKGYCVKALKLHNEAMQISGHSACEQFGISKNKARLRIPQPIICLVSGVSHAVRDKNGLITIVYEDGKNISHYFEMSREDFDTINFLTMVREVQERENFYHTEIEGRANA